MKYVHWASLQSAIKLISDKEIEKKVKAHLSTQIGTDQIISFNSTSVITPFSLQIIYQTISTTESS